MLWIDDEIFSDDAAVRQLAARGFSVDCAGSGATGLAKARVGLYDAILLELRLRDIPGLTVLGTLRQDGLTTPVIVVTSGSDVESAVTAMRLGAADCKSKPLHGDELAASLRSVATPVTFQAPAQPAPAWGVPPTRDAALVMLLANLNTFLAPAQDPVNPRLSTLLVHALADSTLPTLVFVACAEAFQECVSGRHGDRHADFGALVRRLSSRLTGAKPPLNVRVHEFVTRLEGAIRRDHERPCESVLAHQIGVDPAHLGRLLKSHTGLGFRDWRRSVALRHAVPALIHSDARIAQIAYTVGFEHPSQFDREFRYVFGISPTAFRRLTQDMSEPRHVRSLR